MKRMSGWAQGFVVSLVPVFLVTVLPVAATGVVTLEVSTSDGERGGTLPLVVGLTRAEGDSSIASTQLDLIFDGAQLTLAGACSSDGAACQSNNDCGDGRCELLCDKDARLEQQDFNATFPEFQNGEPGERRVRLRLLAPIQVQLPLPTVEDGFLAMCMFDIAPDAPLGLVALRGDRVEVGDEESNVVDAELVIMAGNIVDQFPTPTPTAEVPTETPTPAAETPTPVDTATPTSTPEPQPTNTELVAPTATPPQPTDTPVMAPTVTATVQPTATSPPVATSTPEDSKRGDDDGCAINPDGGSGSGLAWLAFALGAALRLRRRAELLG